MANYNVESADCLDLVRFRVSDHIYVCHASTILKYPNSKLAELIKPENDKRKSGSDLIVLDRDGRIFGMILRLIRNQSCEQLSNHDIVCVMNELDFFQLNELKGYIPGGNEGHPLFKPVPTELRTLDGGKQYKSFNKHTIVIESRSVAGLDKIWKKIIKKVLAIGRFDVCINDLEFKSKSSLTVKSRSGHSTGLIHHDYYDNYSRRGTPEVPDPQEYFRFFLSSRLNGSYQDFPPRLFDLKPDDSKEELIYRGNYVENSKGNFLRFLIAIEMFMRATKPGDLVDIEKRIPGVRFRRYPMPEEAIAEASKTDELPGPSVEESGSESEYVS